jgi:hypothetical protein
MAECVSAPVSGTLYKKTAFSASTLFLYSVKIKFIEKKSIGLYPANGRDRKNQKR